MKKFLFFHENPMTHAIDCGVRCCVPKPQFMKMRCCRNVQRPVEDAVEMLKDLSLGSRYYFARNINCVLPLYLNSTVS